MADEARPFLVLGIGNSLLGDEGFGPACLPELESSLAGHAALAHVVAFVDGGTLSFTLAPMIADCRGLIVIDAAELGQPPGTLQVFEGQAMDAYIGGHRKRSVHEVGLVDLMVMSRLGDGWPALRMLIGVQPMTIGWSEALSAPVAAAVPAACAAARNQLLHWRTLAMR